MPCELRAEERVLSFPSIFRGGITGITHISRDQNLHFSMVIFGVPRFVQETNRFTLLFQ